MLVFVALSIWISGVNSQALVDCEQLRMLKQQQRQQELRPLVPIPKSNLPTLNCDQVEPVKCEDIGTRLQAYASDVAVHEDGLLQYVQEVQTTATSWYTYLCTLEKTTQPIPKGYFSVISVGSDDIASVNEVAAQNHACLKKDLDEILKAVQSCK